MLFDRKSFFAASEKAMRLRSDMNRIMSEKRTKQYLGTDRLKRLHSAEIVLMRNWSERRKLSFLFFSEIQPLAKMKAARRRIHSPHVSPGLPVAQQVAGVCCGVFTGWFTAPGGGAPGMKRSLGLMQMGELLRGHIWELTIEMPSLMTQVLSSSRLVMPVERNACMTSSRAVTSNTRV
jgi:hypothetical protein